MHTGGEFTLYEVTEVVDNTSAASREIDVHPDVAKFLQRYAVGKNGLLFPTRKAAPHLYANLEDRWLTPRLVKLGLDEKGMGCHAIRRYRKTWLRGKRCLEDFSNFWMGHKPNTMSEIYSHLHEETELRLVEAEQVGFGFDFPKAVIAPNAPRIVAMKSADEVAAQATARKGQSFGGRDRVRTCDPLLAKTRKKI